MTNPILAVLLAGLMLAWPAPASAEVETSAQPASRAVHVGFQLGLVSLPRPADFSLFARFYGLIGLGIGYSFFPHALSDRILEAATIREASIDLDALQAELRLFPFRGAFFIGAALGRQSLSARYAPGQESFSAKLDSIYLAPRMGWLGEWDCGFTLGFDFGVQFPLSVNAAVRGNRKLAVNLDDLARQVGNFPVPSLGLRAGWMF